MATITKLESGSTNIWTKQLWLRSPYLNTVLYWLHLSVLTRILKGILEVTVIHASTQHNRTHYLRKKKGRTEPKAFHFPTIFASKFSLPLVTDFLLSHVESYWALRIFTYISQNSPNSPRTAEKLVSIFCFWNKDAETTWGHKQHTHWDRAGGALMQTPKLTSMGLLSVLQHHTWCCFLVPIIHLLLFC